jgi:hypothetical protein
MASDAPKGPGRPSGSRKRQEGDKPFKVWLSQQQRDYLRWLVDHTKYGPTPEDVLQKIVADKLEEMEPSNLRRSTEPPPTRSGRPVP